jgi:hypothetical protein
VASTVATKVYIFKMKLYFKNKKFKAPTPFSQSQKPTSSVFAYIYSLPFAIKMGTAFGYAV